jgi:hypothetical protein
VLQPPTTDPSRPRLLPGSLHHLYRPIQPTTAPPWAPPCPNRPKCHRPPSLEIKSHSSPQPLLTGSFHSLSTPLSLHQPDLHTLPCAAKESEFLNRCCEHVMKLASEPDHLYPSSCLFRNPLLLIYLTIPFFPARKAEDHRPYSRHEAPGTDESDDSGHPPPSRDHPWSPQDLRIHLDAYPMAGCCPR